MLTRNNASVATASAFGSASFSILDVALADDTTQVFTSFGALLDSAAAAFSRCSRTKTSDPGVTAVGVFSTPGEKNEACFTLLSGVVNAWSCRPSAPARAVLN